MTQFYSRGSNFATHLHELVISKEQRETSKRAKRKSFAVLKFQMSVSNEVRRNKLEKTKQNEQKKRPYFLPMYSVVSSEHLPPFSSEVNEKTRKLSLRCLLVLKYALEVESDSSAPEDTKRKKDILTLWHGTNRKQ